MNDPGCQRQLSCRLIMKSVLAHRFWERALAMEVTFSSAWTTVTLFPEGSLLKTPT